MSRSQANEKTSTLLECAISAKPTIVSHPPTYIGLRTARYGPKATNARGGSNGAGVPLPRMAKSAMHVSASGTPAMRTATPSGHVHDGSGPPKIASNCLAHSPTMAHSQTNTGANAMVRIAANSTVMRSPPDPTYRGPRGLVANGSPDSWLRNYRRNLSTAGDAEDRKFNPRWWRWQFCNALEGCAT